MPQAPHWEFTKVAQFLGWELMVAVQEAIACHMSFVAMYINPNTKYNTVPSHLMDQGIPPSRVKDSWTP